MVHGKRWQIPKCVILAVIPSCQDSPTQSNSTCRIRLIIRFPPECTCIGACYGLAMSPTRVTVDIVLREKCACGDRNRRISETFCGLENEPDTDTESYDGSIDGPEPADVGKHSTLQTMRTGFDRKEHKDNADMDRDSTSSCSASSATAADRIEPAKWLRQQRARRDEAHHGVHDWQNAGQPIHFERVDRVYDTTTRDWKLVQLPDGHTPHSTCVFIVRRDFDLQGGHEDTHVEILSSVLRDRLREICAEHTRVDLVEEIPHIQARRLFFLAPALRTYIESAQAVAARYAAPPHAESRAQATFQVQHCQLMLQYLDEEFSQTRDRLEGMLHVGIITHDLVWALFEPGSIAYTSTHGNTKDPRCFLVDRVSDCAVSSLEVHGKYTDHDGVCFGTADCSVNIPKFFGTRKVIDLAVFPLSHHPSESVGAPV
jgi:hypothetical protein